jgi:hypothetical protein
MIKVRGRWDLPSLRYASVAASSCSLGSSGFSSGIGSATRIDGHGLRWGDRRWLVLRLGRRRWAQLGLWCMTASWGGVRHHGAASGSLYRRGKAVRLRKSRPTTVRGDPTQCGGVFPRLVGNLHGAGHDFGSDWGEWLVFDSAERAGACRATAFTACCIVSGLLSSTTWSQLPNQHHGVCVYWFWSGEVEDSLLYLSKEARGLAGLHKESSQD